MGYEEPGFLMDEPTWSQRVKSLRLKLNLTQVQLAERLGIHINTVPLWELRSERPYSRAAELFLQLESEVYEEEEGGVS